MPDFYLTGDESIVLTTQNIVLEKDRYEAIVTTRRLILIRSDDPKAPTREISLREIGSAIAGENSLGQPTITISRTAPDGVLQAYELTFTRKAGEGNSLHHYDEWVSRLKEQVRRAAQEPGVPAGIPVQEESAVAIPAATSPEEETTKNSEEKTGERNTGKNESPTKTETVEETPVVLVPSPESPGESSGAPAEPEAPPVPSAEIPPVKPGSRGFAISPVNVVIITLVIAAILIGAYALTNLSVGNPAAGTALVTTESTTVVTTIPVTTIIPAITTVSPATVMTTGIATPPAPTTTPPSGEGVIVPSTGIYVRVQYPGNFAGSVGIQGSMRDVAGTGDRFYQVPATGRIVDANIQKLDNSGNKLTVTIYSNGKTVRQGNMTAPGGTLSISAWI